MKLKRRIGGILLVLLLAPFSACLAAFVYEPVTRPDPTLGLSLNGWKRQSSDNVSFENGMCRFVVKSKWGGLQVREGSRHLDLDPVNNDRLTFWVKAFPDNGFDNTIGVQFYDHNIYRSNLTRAEVWPRQGSHVGEWTRFEILFKDLPADLNLRDIDRIVIHEYWPGTYYFRDVKACPKILKIKESALLEGTVTWDILPRLVTYTLEESVSGPEGPWTRVYHGTRNTFEVRHLDRRWYRVRWEETDSGPKQIVSEYSVSAEYPGARVNISWENLSWRYVSWPRVKQAGFYEVESAPSEQGPWKQIWRGPYQFRPVRAERDMWYRVRACVGTKDTVVSATPWSRPQSQGKGFLKQDGTTMREDNGKGKELVLKGANLGNCLLIEKWLTGIGNADDPPIQDDYAIRDVLTQRFGKFNSDKLLDTFRASYIRASDIDIIADLGFNSVRLPVSYWLLMDDNGDWITRADGSIDFSRIDRIVDYCADRGIYVLIDLHAAPGGQSKLDHSGRKGYNRLFERSTDGELFRRRTVMVWEAIARHYRDNPWVCGYDLLNEPVGASPKMLRDIYDRLYKAIRAIDKEHLIMMEGAWDWKSLPDPNQMGWTNIAYQFHYYMWWCNEDLDMHQSYIDGKIANNRRFQALYKVPVMIGEFTAFNTKDVWDYYMSHFTQEKYSWMMWNFKSHFSPSEWGLFNHSNYDASPAHLRAVQKDGSKGDTYAELVTKFSRYSTADYHTPNHAFIRLLQGYIRQPGELPGKEIRAAITIPDVADFQPEPVEGEAVIVPALPTQP
ncbi:MAG: glycoside hydrolase family 5 protein [Deltaproteobacteria bacterium]